MPRHYVVKLVALVRPHGPDAFTVHDDGRVTSHRTGLVERGFASLADALATYGLAREDLEEVATATKFSERPATKP
ncbi:MAG: hypothetical protein ACXVEF_05520 [Polyangiales bacterium]